MDRLGSDQWARHDDEEEEEIDPAVALKQIDDDQGAITRCLQYVRCAAELLLAHPSHGVIPCSGCDWLGEFARSHAHYVAAGGLVLNENNTIATIVGVDVDEALAVKLDRFITWAGGTIYDHMVLRTIAGWLSYLVQAAFAVGTVHDSVARTAKPEDLLALLLAKPESVGASDMNLLDANEAGMFVTALCCKRYAVCKM